MNPAGCATLALVKVHYERIVGGIGGAANGGEDNEHSSGGGATGRGGQQALSWPAVRRVRLR